MAAGIETSQRAQFESPKQLDFWGIIPRPPEVIVYQSYFGPVVLPSLDNVRAKLPKLQFVGGRQSFPPTEGIIALSLTHETVVFVERDEHPVALAADQ